MKYSVNDKICLTVKWEREKENYAGLQDNIFIIHGTCHMPFSYSVHVKTVTEITTKLRYRMSQSQSLK